MCGIFVWGGGISFGGGGQCPSPHPPPPPSSTPLRSKLLVALEIFLNMTSFLDLSSQIVPGAHVHVSSVSSWLDFKYLGFL